MSFFFLGGGGGVGEEQKLFLPPGASCFKAEKLCPVDKTLSGSFYPCKFHTLDMDLPTG